MSQYLTVFKKGDLVDVKANGSITSGMPHKFYHGKTGKIWNVGPRSVGVELNKRVNNRILKKRIHVRIEHVQPSRCREDFIKRLHRNNIKKKIAARQRKRVTLKRTPVRPRRGAIILPYAKVETLKPMKYELLV